VTHLIRYAARSDRGLLRANNQDSVFAGDRLLIIADGMGGHAAGDVASRLVVGAFVDLDELPLGSDMVRPLSNATRQGNAAIAEMVGENPDLDGMGTTLTALLFDGPLVALAHVGDSRAYLYRNGVLHQISHDDTFVQSLVDEGRISADEAAHHPQRSLLLRALNGTEMDPSITMREISAGDRFLLCSDGLSDVVSPESIADALAGQDTDQVADTLIQLALVGGGPDNVTVIVADVLETGTAETLGAADEASDSETTGPMQPIHLTQRMPRVPLPPIPEDVPAKAQYAAAQEGPEQISEDELDQQIQDDEPDSDDFEDDTDERHQSTPGDRDDEDDQDADSAQLSDTTLGTRGPTTPATRHSRWFRRCALALAVLVLVAVGLAGAVLWANTKYYIGQNGRQVAIFKGINGSLLGWKFASVQENSCATTGASDGSACTPLIVADLVQAARDQVSAGIQVGTLSDARAVITRLAFQQLPFCVAAGATSSVVASAPTTPPAPTTPAAPTSLPAVAASGATELSTTLLTGTVLTTLTVTPIEPTSITQSGAPLVSPAAQPGLNCRLVP